MKDWVYGRRLFDEQPGNEGEAGGGVAPGAQGDAGEANAAAAALEQVGGGVAPGAQGGVAPDSSKTDSPKTDPQTLTDEEKKAYSDAFRLDEATFGKGVQFDPKFAERMPAFFKKYGIEPAKANEMANEFAKMQKDVEADSLKKGDEFKAWRQGELKKMNDAYLATYDKAGRETIARGILHFFPQGTPMYDAIRFTEIGVDPGFLKLMHFAGERLPKDKAPGAAAGAGSGSGKSLADSFMGL